MVYLKSWTEFEATTTELYKRNPYKVRYCVKFRPQEGILVLKVTDDYKCLKFKSHSSIILNRFESLNLRLLLLMSNSKPVSTNLPSVPASNANVTGESKPSEGKDELTGIEGKVEGLNVGGGVSAGGKKKKKGKK